MTNQLPELSGKTILRIDTDNDSFIKFYLSDGNLVTMQHHQDCCENVYLENVVGDFKNLLYSPIIQADEKITQGGEQGCETHTYTFYTLATVKGYVDLRWNGESNGYYSESVDFSTDSYDLTSLPNYQHLKDNYPEAFI